MTTMQKIAVSAALTATIGAGIYEAKQTSNARAEVTTLQKQQIPLALEIARLQARETQLSNLLAQATEQRPAYDLKPYAATSEQKAALDKLVQAVSPAR